jgi:hypothetical protein
MRRVCEMNQLDRKTYGHPRAGTVCTYSLSGKICRHRLGRSKQRPAIKGGEVRTSFVPLAVGSYAIRQNQLLVSSVKCVGKSLGPLPSGLHSAGPRDRGLPIERLMSCFHGFKVSVFTRRFIRINCMKSARRDGLNVACALADRKGRSYTLTTIYSLRALRNHNIL